MVSGGTHVVCGRFSVNHQVEVNGVHQVSTQCQYWVWGHWAKFSGYTKASYHLPMDLPSGAWFWRVIRAEPVECIRLTQSKIWLSGGKALHRSHGALGALRTTLALKLCNSALPVRLWHCLNLPRNLQKFFKEDCILGPGCLPPADFPAVCQLGRAGPQGVSRVGSAYLPGWYHMEESAWVWNHDICGPGGRVTQHRDIGDCPSRPLLEATQLNLSLYDPAPLWAVLPLPEPGVSEILCVGPLRGLLGF